MRGFVTIIVALSMLVIVLWDETNNYGRGTSAVIDVASQAINHARHLAQ